MNLKKTLVGIIGASMISLGACTHVPHRAPVPPTFQPAPKIEISYDDDGSSLDEKTKQEVQKSVEKVKTTAEYRVTVTEENILGEIISERTYNEKLSWIGSCTIIEEANKNYYALTAQHVVDTPEKLSFQIDISDLDELEKTILENLHPRLYQIPNFGNDEEIEVLGLKYDKFPLKGGIEEFVQDFDEDFDEDNIIRISAERINWYMELKDIKITKTEPSDEDLDYAILTMPSNGKLHPLSKNKKVHLGNSNILRTCDYVYVVGYPLGLGKVISEGIVGKNELPPKQKFGEDRPYGFLFSAPISPGNSGGPIFAVKNGEMFLVGEVSAYYVRGKHLFIGYKISDILLDVNQKIR